MDGGQSRGRLPIPASAISHPIAIPVPIPIPIPVSIRLPTLTPEYAYKEDLFCTRETAERR